MEKVGILKLSFNMSFFNYYVEIVIDVADDQLNQLPDGVVSGASRDVFFISPHGLMESFNAGGNDVGSYGRRSVFRSQFCLSITAWPDLMASVLPLNLGVLVSGFDVVALFLSFCAALVKEVEMKILLFRLL